MEAPASGGPAFDGKSGGGKPAGEGISISLPLHPILETTNQGGLRAPLLDVPPGLSCRSIPTEGAYVVTPPRFGAGGYYPPLRGARRPRRAAPKGKKSPGPKPGGPRYGIKTHQNA